MTKPKFETPDMTQKNIDKIAQLFPNCITETKDENGNLKKAVNFELLQQMLSDEIADKDEAYEFTWVGKKAAIVEANKPIRKTLRPCKEESVNWDTTENLYIEGDNLEVLKLLQESYLGKVKMIYIDPPYNTGNDFIYKDDFTSSSEEYAEDVGLFDEAGNRMFKNTDTNGRFHSDWCSMIYSRLMLARNLLSDDGVIFISIDDNEVDSLTKICSEIFGEENHAGNIIVKSNPRGSMSSAEIANLHEYIVVFTKRRAEAKIIGHKLSEDMVDEYNLIDEIGNYRLLGLRMRGGFWRRSERPKLFFPIYVNPIDKTISLEKSKTHYEEALPIQPTTGEEGTWRWSKEKIANESNYLIGKTIQRNGEICWDIYQKDYLNKNGERRTKAKSIWDEPEVNYQNGTEEIKKLLGSSSFFDYSKPPFLIKHCIEMIDFNYDNQIILDFFSGSATTAQSVMQSNIEDSGNRKFIMVQLPEKIDEKSEAYKSGYKNICEIGKERIRRAGKQILELRLENLEKEGVIEKYARKLSEIRSLEEVYGCGGTSVSASQETSKGRALCSVRSDETGGRIHSVKHSGRAVSREQGIYPVFENSKGLTGRAGNTIVDLCTLEILNNFGYRINFGTAGRNKQDALFPDEDSNTENLELLSSKLSVLNSDIGFRVLKVDDSNMKDVYYSASEYDQTKLDMFESNIKEDRNDLDLLFGCLLDWGLPLSLPYTSETIGKFTVHTYNDGDLVACFNEDVSEEVVKEIARKKPLRAVFRDSSFSNSASKINVFEIFKMISPETSVKVI